MRMPKATKTEKSEIGKTEKDKKEKSNLIIQIS